MCLSPLHPLIEALPKCEHHMHVEGSLSPELLFVLAKRNNISLPSDDPAFASVESLYARYDRFTCLDDFLHYYYIGMNALITAQDFEDLAMAYFAKAHAARVRHAEIFFDPQAHLARGVSLDVIVRGLRAASALAEQRWGLTSLLIPCLLRHLPVADSGRMGAELDAYWGEGGLAGLGLCSSERNLPPTLWQEVYEQVRSTAAAGACTRKPRFTAHAGEEGPAEYITMALDRLGAERIDHGVAAASDPAVMARLARDNVMLTVCPLSNVRLQVADSVADVPIRTLLDAGVPFSLNSDDPAYFGGYMLENYCAVQEAHDLSPADWATITRSAVTGSWCDDARKAVLLAEIDSVLADWHAGKLVAA